MALVASQRCVSMKSDTVASNIARCIKMSLSPSKISIGEASLVLSSEQWCKIPIMVSMLAYFCIDCDDCIYFDVCCCICIQWMSRLYYRGPLCVRIVTDARWQSGCRGGAKWAKNSIPVVIEMANLATTQYETRGRWNKWPRQDPQTNNIDSHWMYQWSRMVWRFAYLIQDMIVFVCVHEYRIQHCVYVGFAQ